MYLLVLSKNDATKLSRKPRPKQIGEMPSLATVRDALLVSRYSNIIEDVELTCLYNANIRQD